jgi:hypothetical protein
MILFESEIPDRIYTRQQIRKWFVEERDSYFRSKDCMFTIEFYRGEPGSSDRKSIDEVPFKFERPMKKDSMDDAAASVDSAGPSI